MELVGLHRHWNSVRILNISPEETWGGEEVLWCPRASVRVRMSRTVWLITPAALSALLVSSEQHRRVSWPELCLGQ